MQRLQGGGAWDAPASEAFPRINMAWFHRLAAAQGRAVTPSLQTRPQAGRKSFLVRPSQPPWGTVAQTGHAVGLGMPGRGLPEALHQALKIPGKVLGRWEFSGASALEMLLARELRSGPCSPRLASAASFLVVVVGGRLFHSAFLNQGLATRLSPHTLTHARTHTTHSLAGLSGFPLCPPGLQCAWPSLGPHCPREGCWRHGGPPARSGSPMAASSVAATRLNIT